MKKLILGIIIGSLLSGTIVYAVTYNAKQIDFIPSNNEWKNEGITTVDGALNYLYENKGLSNISDRFGEPIYGSNAGNRAPRTATVKLNKGDYIVSAIDNATGVNTNSQNSGFTNEGNLNLSCDDCDITSLSFIKHDAWSTTKLWSSIFLDIEGKNEIYYIKIKKDETIVSLSNGFTSTSNDQSSGVMLTAIPIN